jgi:hypothetical protein
MSRLQTRSIILPALAAGFTFSQLSLAATRIWDGGKWRQQPRSAAAGFTSPPPPPLHVVAVPIFPRGRADPLRHMSEVRSSDVQWTNRPRSTGSDQPSPTNWLGRCGRGDGGWSAVLRVAPRRRRARRGIAPSTWGACGRRGWHLGALRSVTDSAEQKVKSPRGEGASPDARPQGGTETSLVQHRGAQQGAGRPRRRALPRLRIPTLRRDRLVSDTDTSTPPTTHAPPTAPAPRPVLNSPPESLSSSPPRSSDGSRLNRVGATHSKAVSPRRPWGRDWADRTERSTEPRIWNLFAWSGGAPAPLRAVPRWALDFDGVVDTLADVERFAFERSSCDADACNTSQRERCLRSAAASDGGAGTSGQGADPAALPPLLARLVLAGAGSVWRP